QLENRRKQETTQLQERLQQQKDQQEALRQRERAEADAAREREREQGQQRLEQQKQRLEQQKQQQEQREQQLREQQERRLKQQQRGAGAGGKRGLQQQDGAQARQGAALSAELTAARAEPERALGARGEKVDVNAVPASLQRSQNRLQSALAQAGNGGQR